jgi:hypothetical protein
MFNVVKDIKYQFPKSNLVSILQVIGYVREESIFVHPGAVGALQILNDVALVRGIDYGMSPRNPQQTPMIFGEVYCWWRFAGCSAA